MSFDIIEIPSGKIGLVEAKKGGNPAFSGRFGRVVECQNFQDEIAFINNVRLLKNTTKGDKINGFY